jgi:ubiquinone/menaquinone biosynthesis C-methylase UbiE
MNKTDQKQKLNKLYDRWHEIQHGKDVADRIHMDPWHRNVIGYIGDFSTFNDQEVLEIGTGPGDFALFVSDFTKKTTAIDFSETAIKIADKKAKVQKKDIRFLVADAMNLPYEDESYDTIFSFECLEHVPEPDRMIRECFRVLKKGGKVYLTTENYSNGLILRWIYTWITGRKFDSGTDQPYENFFIYSTLLKKFKKAGFKPVTWFGTHHVFLVLPRMHPHTFVIDRFRKPFVQKIFRPLARHMTYVLEK